MTTNTQAAAAAIAELINSSPRTPAPAEIERAIAMHITKSVPSPLLAELRRVRPLMEAAVAEFQELDERDDADDAQCKAAAARARNLEAEWDSLARQAWRSPNRDLALLGEIALGYSNAKGLRARSDQEQDDLREVSIAELLMAVERGGEAQPDLG